MGVVALFVTILTTIGNAVSSAARRPVQRAVDAATLLALLDQVKASEQAVFAEDRQDLELRRDLADIIRGNVGRYAAAPMHEPGDDTWRMIFVVEFILFLGFGGLQFVSDQPGSTEAGVFFLALAVVVGFGAGQAHIVYQRRRRAHVLAGLEPSGSWFEMQAQFVNDLRMAFRRWRHQRSK